LIHGPVARWDSTSSAPGQDYRYSGAAGARIFAEGNKLLQQIFDGELDAGLLNALNQVEGHRLPTTGAGEASLVALNHSCNKCQPTEARIRL